MKTIITMAGLFVAATAAQQPEDPASKGGYLRKGIAPGDANPAADRAEFAEEQTLFCHRA